MGAVSGNPSRAAVPGSVCPWPLASPAQLSCWLRTLQASPRRGDSGISAPEAVPARAAYHGWLLPVRGPACPRGRLSSQEGEDQRPGHGLAGKGPAPRLPDSLSLTLSRLTVHFPVTLFQSESRGPWGQLLFWLRRPLTLLLPNSVTLASSLALSGSRFFYLISAANHNISQGLGEAPGFRSEATWVHPGSVTTEGVLTSLCLSLLIRKWGVNGTYLAGL